MSINSGSHTHLRDVIPPWPVILVLSLAFFVILYATLGMLALRKLCQRSLGYERVPDV